MTLRLRHSLAAAAGAILLALSGCKAPTVNLATQEPIKVDINVRLDVYQYGQEKEKKPAPQVSGAAQVEGDPASRRRNRMADIQTFKNSRLVGESRNGLLVVRDEPPGEYGTYVRKTVDAENDDRMSQMKDLAESRKTSLMEIQKEQAELWRNRAFQGELIEVEVEPGQWRWTAKE